MGILAILYKDLSIIFGVCYNSRDGKEYEDYDM